MESDPKNITMLLRREIEAGIAGPIIRGFIEEMGREKALAVVRKTIDALALESGRALAGSLGGNSLADFAKGMEMWQAGGAYDLEELELTPEVYAYNITRCRYAEMYRLLGLADLGAALSCQRDFKLVEGFNPGLRLERTQTIMEGGAFCDFRIKKV